MMVTLKRVCIKAFFILLMKMFPKKNSKDKLIGELKVPFLMSKIKVRSISIKNTPFFVESGQILSKF